MGVVCASSAGLTCAQLARDQHGADPPWRDGAGRYVARRARQRQANAHGRGSGGVIRSQGPSQSVTIREIPQPERLPPIFLGRHRYQVPEHPWYKGDYAKFGRPHMELVIRGQDPIDLAEPRLALERVSTPLRQLEFYRDGSHPLPENVATNEVKGFKKIGLHDGLSPFSMWRELFDRRTGPRVKQVMLEACREARRMLLDALQSNILLWVNTADEAAPQAHMVQNPSGGALLV